MNQFPQQPFVFKLSYIKFIEIDSRKSVPNLTPIVGHDICKMFSAQAYHATSDHRHLKNIVDLITVIKDNKYSWLTEVK